MMPCASFEHSSQVPNYLPMLLNSAPLRCGVGKGRPEQCVQKWLCAHKKRAFTLCSPGLLTFSLHALAGSFLEMLLVGHHAFGEGT